MKRARRNVETTAAMEKKEESNEQTATIVPDIKETNSEETFPIEDWAELRRKRIESFVQVRCEAGQSDDRRKGAKHDITGKNSEYMCRDTDFVTYLCQNGAFTEAEALATFSRLDEGIKIICTKQYHEKIKTYIRIARVLVFQESIKQRFERAKKKFEDKEDRSNEHEEIQKFKEIISNNDIDLERFFKSTYEHFMKRTGKKNNLFFLGPPSTGKTMIMNSLVECHFNYRRLTGLVSNFSGLLHTNACLMDDCKLTDNQFEQWKMLASGMPMSTYVKYMDRCDVKDCVLYTCSNYPIETYCNVPMAREAVSSRTIKFEFKKRFEWYFKISPHIWEKCWKEYDLTV